MLGRVQIGRNGAGCGEEEEEDGRRPDDEKDQDPHLATLGNQCSPLVYNFHLLTNMWLEDCRPAPAPVAAISLVWAFSGLGKWRDWTRRPLAVGSAASVLCVAFQARM